MKRYEVDTTDNSINASGPSPGVVVLDDEAPILNLVPAVLRREGLVVYPTRSETEAWKMLGYPGISTLIQDFNRGPDACGGLAFARRMLNCSLRRRKFLVIHSGSGRDSIFGAFKQLEKIPAAEIFYFLEKPALYHHWEELVRTIKALAKSDENGKKM